MIESETGHILECLKLYGIFINIRETLHMSRENIVATSMKILLENLFSVKCYDKSNNNPPFL